MPMQHEQTLIEVHEDLDRLTFRLPAKSANVARVLWRILGWIFVGYLVLALGLGLGVGLGLGMGLMVLVFIFPPLFPLAVLYWVLRSAVRPTQLWAAGGRLCALDRIGPAKIERSVTMEDLGGLAHSSLQADGSGVDSWKVPLIVVPRAGQTPIILVYGYEQPLLEELVQVLRERLPGFADRNGWTVPNLPVGPLPTIPLSSFKGLEPLEGLAVLGGTTPDASGAPLPQPEQSTIVCERFPDGVTLTIPPVGVRRQKLMGPAMVLLLVGIGLLVGPYAATQLFNAKPPVAFLAVMGSIVTLMGLGCLLGAINMGRRQAVLAKVGDQLWVLQTGLFGARRHEWALPDVRQIRVGPSGLKINEQAVPELKIETQSGERTGPLAGGPVEELLGLADVRARAVGLDRRPAEPPAASEEFEA
ncbi:MAG TPA: hypothetical protein PKC45_04580 [Gemmatales bacterium]|nr:hypothetical protein [Gemmatales bacterium]